MGQGVWNNKVEEYRGKVHWLSGRRRATGVVIVVSGSGATFDFVVSSSSAATCGWEEKLEEVEKYEDKPNELLGRIRCGCPRKVLQHRSV